MQALTNVGNSRLQTLLKSRSLALLSLLVLWALVRVYPITRIEPLISWEVWQAHKMLDYGFWARRGAMILALPEAGIVANPAAFNFTHHPYPYQWLCTLLYSMCGPLGLCVVAMAARLGICAAVFLALDRYFDRFSAWCGTAVYVLSPILILLEAKDPPHSTVMSVALAPLGVLALGLRSQGAPALTGMRRWWPGLLVFLLGQVDWFALSIVPALLVLNQDWSGGWRRNWKSALTNPVSVGMLAGAALTAAVFFAQVALYEPNFAGVRSHLISETGEGQPISRWSLLLLYFPLRSVLFVGGALLVGAISGLFCWGRGRSPLVLAAGVNLASLAVVVFALPMYFYKENSLYPAFVFPAAVLTALAIQSRPRILPWVLVVLCLPGVLEAQLYASVRWVSANTRSVARFIADHSEKTDMIVTNLELGRPPFDPNDGFAMKGTRITADRLILFGYLTPKQLLEVPAVLQRSDAPMLYLLAQSCPISPELLKQVRENGRLVANGSVQLSPHASTLAEKLKAFVYYRVMQKAASPQAAAKELPAEEVFELYRLQ